MKIIKLSQGLESVKEIEKFLLNNYKEYSSLLFCDKLSESIMKIECQKEEVLSCVGQVTNIEHDFPEYIWFDELKNSIVIGMNFCKGHLETNTCYKFTNGKFMVLSSFECELIK